MSNVRIVVRPPGTACGNGYCLGGCSHMMWVCSDCGSEGGLGAPKEKIQQYADEHVCPAAETGETMKIIMDIHIGGEQATMSLVEAGELAETLLRYFPGAAISMTPVLEGAYE